MTDAEARARELLLRHCGEEARLVYWRDALRAIQDALALAAPSEKDAEWRVVFDGPPGHESGRFVECETADGRSVSVGQWHERPDGFWELRIADRLATLTGPGEVTDAMIDAGCDAWVKCGGHEADSIDLCRAIYAAMQSSSPPPKEAKHEG